jgi:hypothetical protein
MAPCDIPEKELKNVLSPLSTMTTGIKDEKGVYLEVFVYGNKSEL